MPGRDGAIQKGSALIPVIVLLSQAAASCTEAGSEPGRQVPRDSSRASTLSTSLLIPECWRRTSIFGDTEEWQWAR